MWSTNISFLKATAKEAPARAAPLRLVGDPHQKYMGGCQNYGPFLGTLNIRCRTIMGTQKGTIILTTTHIELEGLCRRGLQVEAKISSVLKQAIACNMLSRNLDRNLQGFPLELTY